MKTYTFTSRNSSDFKERLTQIETFLNNNQIRALESMKEVMIVEETDESGNVVSLNVIDTYNTESTNKRGRIQSNYEVLKGDNSILLRSTYKDSLLHKIESIRNSQDPPFHKLTNLIHASRDYEINGFRLIMAKLGKKLKTSDGEFVSYLPNLVAFLLEIAAVEAEHGETKTMQQWYDTIISFLERLESKSEEGQCLKSENLSLKNKVRDMEEQLRAAEARDNQRIKEIDKWHGLYKHAEAEGCMWRRKYEEAMEQSKRAESDKQAAEKLRRENAQLHEYIDHLQKRQASDKAIITIAKNYLNENPISTDVILRRFPDDEAYKKKEKALEDKIKNLQEKLGNESVPLSVLAEGLMDYAEEAGIRETHELFNHLNNLLINVSAWTKNVPELKKFFKKARKEMEARTINMTGDNATYNENK